MTVIAHTDGLSKKICRDLLRDGMRAAPATIVDPKAAQRAAAKSEFIVTAFPSRDPLYPLIVVEEQNDAGGRISRTDALEEHDYTATIRVESENSTHLFTLRDQVRRWIGANVATFAAAGWIDVNIIASTPANNELAPDVKVWQLVLRGKAYAS